MTKSSDQGDAGPNRRNDRRKLGGKSKLGGIAVVILLGIYSFAAPQLNARFGWDLPQLRSDADGNIALADPPTDRVTSQQPSASSQVSQDKATETRTAKNANAKTTAAQSDLAAVKRGASTQNTSSPATSATKSKRDGTPETRAGPLAGRVGTTRSTSGKNATQESSVGASDETLQYGLLREVSRDRFISPAGLLYTPGSAEGHRLEHLRRHTKDDPRRPGKHGVFDGGMEGALKTIDRAYERAKKGQRTTKEVDRGRTIYRVDMGGRVGYVGGREGGRTRNPMARRVQLVLEGNRVITAYPM